MKNTCYMCNAVATGKEHVPPRCLFPESKAVGGLDYRKNLITVPSCDQHNSKKSKDDEYFHAVLPVYYKNGFLAERHIDTKVTHSLRHSPKIAVGLVEGGGVCGGGLALMNVDFDRIFNVCEHMSKGLYYHHFKSRWTGSIEFTSHAFLASEDIKHSHKPCCLIEEKLDGWFHDNSLGFRGDNPDVFKYRLFSDQKSHFFIQLIFYDGVCVSGISQSID